MIVIKFGGTAVQDVDAMRDVVGIVHAEVAQEQALGEPRAPMMVISALARVTNHLTEAAKRLRDGSRIDAENFLASIMQRHDSMARALGLRRVAAILHEFDRLFDRLKCFSPNDNFLCFMDEILAAGELASSRLFTEALTESGIRAQWIDARLVVTTDDDHTKAVPDRHDTEENARTRILPLAEQGIVTVIGGFIGRSKSGATTTLGREGSDYTATLLGACLEAREVHKWTDVDGIKTANPRIDASAETIDRMSLAAADTFAKTAGMIHPRTIEPLLGTAITLVIRNIKNPGHPGTRIANGG